MRIGNLARLTGTNVPTIRYYEQIGLLSLADRQDGGQRVYAQEDIEQLAFIRRCRDFGFPIQEIRKLLVLQTNAAGVRQSAREIAARHLSSIHDKLAELNILRKNFEELLARCEQNCCTSAIECTALKEMKQPRHG